MESSVGMEVQSSAAAGQALASDDARVEGAGTAPREWSLARLYAACLRLADAGVAHHRLVLAIAAPVILIGLAAVSRLVLERFANSGDEYVYLYQAATLAEGRLWNEPPLVRESFLFNYIVHEVGRVYGSFPVGWPLLLAGAMRLHVPVWLVNPLVGALSLWLLVRLGAALYTPRIGVLAAGLVGTSSFFIFNASSYFSHTFCAALLLGAACLAARDDRSPAWVPFGVGFLLGWAVLARYFTGAICGLPIALLLLRRDAPPARTIAWLTLGGLPWIVVLALYNSAMTGSPLKLTTTPVTYGLWFSEGFLTNGALVTASHVLRFVLWAPPVMLAAYVWALRVAPRHLRRGLLDWMLVLLAGGLYFYVELGGNQYGPRFYYEAFPFMALFVTAVLFRHDRLEDAPAGDRRMFAAMAASVAVMPLALALHARAEHRVILERSDVYADVARSGLQDAVVLVPEEVGTERPMGALDLTRNGLTFDGNVLYARDLGLVQNCQVGASYPGRSIWLYAWNLPQRRGSLRAVRCDPAFLEAWKEGHERERRLEEARRRRARPRAR